MRKLSFFAIVAFAIILTSTLTVTDGFAKRPSSAAPPPTGHTSTGTYDRANLQVVTAPSSVNCVGLGLVPDGWTGKDNGLVSITGHSVYVRVQNTAPNTVYMVSIGYLKTNGCNGSWKSVGSITTDQAGNGQLAAHFKLSSNEYMVELLNGDGSIAYATSFMSM